MRNKGIAVFALTSALILGTCLTSLAAEGWKLEGNAWVYYDANDQKVTDVWKKGADNLWRFLDGNGQMVLSSWVDEAYYVDNNGLLVTDKWLKLRPPYWNQRDEDVFYWYYFGSSGKITSDSWKKINDKWYYFNSDGSMKTGWQEDSYYLGGTDDGVMRTGWQKLKPPEDDGEDHKVTPGTAEGSGEYWYYFASNGKLGIPDLSGDKTYGTVKINGGYYCFDSKGVMQTGWKNMSATDNSSKISDYKCFADDGKMRTGWLYTAAPSEVSKSFFDDENQWFYFGTNGTPNIGPQENKAKVSDLVRINGSTYLFNETGNVVYGLQNIEGYAYYFGTKTQSSMQVGKQTSLEEGDGSISVYYFTESGSARGRGYTGVKDDYLYYKGKRQQADSASKYLLITIPDAGATRSTYVVNASGKVQKSTTVKDGNQNTFKTNSKGILTKINNVDATSRDTGEPIEPVFNN